MRVLCHGEGQGIGTDTAWRRDNKTMRMTSFTVFEWLVLEDAVKEWVTACRLSFALEEAEVESQWRNVSRATCFDSIRPFPVHSIT